MPQPTGPEVDDWSGLLPNQTVDLYFDEETRYDGVKVAVALGPDQAHFWVNGVSQLFFRRSGHRVFLR